MKISKLTVLCQRVLTLSLLLFLAFDQGLECYRDRSRVSVTVASREGQRRERPV